MLPWLIVRSSHQHKTDSNLGLALLGHAVNAAARNKNSDNSVNSASFEQQLVQDIISPLNLTRTGFFNSVGGGIIPGAANPAKPVPSAW